jgi:predicted phosphoribosyltransferase
MSADYFVDRADAGRQLAARMAGIPLTDPLVLAIPRGGIEVGAPLARAVGGDLDVVLSRKLRAPGQPELALGAIAETGEVYLDPYGTEIALEDPDYLDAERRRQLAEIERRRAMIRAVRPQASVAGRSVIVTDDGIATGSTMIAALRMLRAAHAGEVIVAVPVAASQRLKEIRSLCDRVVCLSEPDDLYAIGQYYRDFDQVTDERVLELLREFAGRSPDAARHH